MRQDSAINTSKLEAAQPFILSRSPDKAMQEMMEAIDALKVIYVEENEALTSADTNRFLSLQDKKLSAARNYQIGTEQILARKEEFKNIDPVLRQKLVAKQEEFAALGAANLDAIARVRKSVQRLGERIMGAARDAAKKDAPNYSARGNLNNGDRRVSIGINESA